MIKNQNQNQKAFTIIEMAVVVAVFLFIIGAAIGIFLSIIKDQRRVLSEQQLLNQVSYVEEYMSKALRMAAADDATTDPSNNCIPSGYIYLLTPYDPELGLFRGIKFLNQNDVDESGKPVCHEFYLDNKTDPAKPVLREIKGAGDGQPILITSSDLKINFIKFSINGSDGSVPLSCGSYQDCGATIADRVQPRVTIVFNISLPGETAARIIQTTVSQRNLNVK